MGWLERLHWKREKRNEEEWSAKQSLVNEIRKAHSDWSAAHMKLEWVVEKDQIDCAIYALEAAEKRYEMLLRQAKHYGWLDGDQVVAAAKENG